MLNDALFRLAGSEVNGMNGATHQSGRERAGQMYEEGSEVSEETWSLCLDTALRPFDRIT